MFESAVDQDGGVGADRSAGGVATQPVTGCGRVGREPHLQELVPVPRLLFSGGLLGLERSEYIRGHSQAEVQVRGHTAMLRSEDWRLRTSYLSWSTRILAFCRRVTGSFCTKMSSLSQLLEKTEM